MFSPEIVDSDSFLEMPHTARLLYYDLGIRADDDGFVHPLKVVRLTGANPDDISILLAKGYIWRFDDGVVVITHWLINNKIPKDKYTQSIYFDRLEELRIGGIYSDKLPTGRPKQHLLALNSTKEPLKESFRDPLGVPQVRLGKDSEEKKKIIKKENKRVPLPPDQWADEFKEKYPNKQVPELLQQAYAWLQATGKVYKDYKQFYNYWLMRSNGSGSPSPYQRQDVDLSKV